MPINTSNYQVIFLHPNCLVTGLLVFTTAQKNNKSFSGSNDGCLKVIENHCNLKGSSIISLVLIMHCLFLIMVWHDKFLVKLSVNFLGLINPIARWILRHRFLFRWAVFFFLNQAAFLMWTSCFSLSFVTTYLVEPPC